MTAEDVKTMIEMASYTDAADVHWSTSLAELGMDSLDTLHLIDSLETKSELKFPNEKFRSPLTVGTLVEFFAC